jgi:hypothetical protein
LLVLANKNDLPGALGVDDLIAKMRLGDIGGRVVSVGGLGATSAHDSATQLPTRQSIISTLFSPGLRNVRTNYVILPSSASHCMYSYASLHNKTSSVESRCDLVANLLLQSTATSLPEVVSELIALGLLGFGSNLAVRFGNVRALELAPSLGNLG